MTAYQKIAIGSPCRFAFETANPQFGRLLITDGVSLVLTVNNGYE